MVGGRPGVRHVCVVTGRLFGLPIPAGPLVDLLLIARGFLIVDVLFITSVSCMHDVFILARLILGVSHVLCPVCMSCMDHFNICTVFRRGPFKMCCFSRHE